MSKKSVSSHSLYVGKKIYFLAKKFFNLIFMVGKKKTVLSMKYFCLALFLTWTVQTFLTNANIHNQKASATFTAQQKLSVRADIFNFINRANFGIPIRFLGAVGFGEATNTITPGRRIQFALKYSF